MRKMISTLSVFALILAVAVSANAQGIDQGPVKSVNKCGFHCDACKPGGGDVSKDVLWLDEGAEDWVPYLGKSNVPNSGDIWLVQDFDLDPSGHTWVIQDGQGIFMCGLCGGTEWVSYSNNNGVFSGKNVQLYGPGIPVNDEYGWLKGLASGSVFEKVYFEVHKPVYREYSFQTLVSAGNKLNVTLPAGVTGEFLNNGMPYLKVTKTALEQGITIQIAESNKSGGNTISAAWNTPVPGGKSYTAKLTGQTLVVTSNLPGFGVLLSDKAFSGNPVSQIKHDEKTIYSVSNWTKATDFYLFFHIGSAKWFSDTEIIGCEVDYVNSYEDWVEIADSRISFDFIDDTTGHCCEADCGLACGEETHAFPVGDNCTVCLKVDGVCCDEMPVTVIKGLNECVFGRVEIEGGSKTVVVCCDSWVCPGCTCAPGCGN